MYRHMYSILNVYCYEPNCRHTCGLFHVVNKSPEPPFISSMVNVNDLNNMTSKHKHMFNHNLENDPDYRDKLGSLDIPSVDSENDQSKLISQNSVIINNKKESVTSSTRVEWLANQEFLNELLSEDESLDFSKYPRSSFFIDNDDSDEELQELLRRVKNTTPTIGSSKKYNFSNSYENNSLFEDDIIDDELERNSLFSQGIYDGRRQDGLLQNYENNL
ncbi:Hypothetical protein SRAE_X000108100 [Strongyloides ratti]|uniref:Uncharacterized protein n=1 Tax=Strongyloides ratti TaxID=34506 RepID=A0A090MMT0_STRRB|nr:Hypothetical protein SRAE_X000108100 [Strongyloides ratti]CEF59331.1 Hypothetical protein SRAE_X000108100 [Strongyloides ratti]